MYESVIDDVGSEKEETKLESIFKSRNEFVASV